MKNPSVISFRVMGRMAGLASVVLLMFVLALACEDEGDLPKYDPPANHTISKEGRLHMSGLEDPLNNCVSCHGNDLKGGNTGVSCYECHDKEW